MNYFVYLIVSKNQKKEVSYVGFAKDLEKRIFLHNASRGAKFTRGRKWKLVYYKKYNSKIIAMREEYKLKKNYILRKRIVKGLSF